MADDRVVVAEGVRSYAAELNEMRQDLGKLAAELSDLVLLRYILSFKKPKAAATALRTGLEYREANAGWLKSAVEVVDNAKGGVPTYEEYMARAPHAAKLRKHLAGGYHGVTHQGGPLCFIRAGITDLSKLMDECSEKELEEFFVWDKEVTYAMCHKATLESGKITKALYVMDSTGVSVFRQDRRFFAALGASSKISENLHPQLVQRQCVINAGSTFKILFKVAAVFMSKKTVERFAVCGGFDQNRSAAECPYASRWVEQPDSLPSFSGGSCSAHGGRCVADVPNDYTAYKIDLEP